MINRMSKLNDPRTLRLQKLTHRDSNDRNHRLTRQMAAVERQSDLSVSRTMSPAALLRLAPFLSAIQLENALPIPLCMQGISDALQFPHHASLRPQYLNTLFMPASVGDCSGFKAVSVNPGKPEGTVFVMPPEGGIGVVDGPSLTRIRTAAITGLACGRLAPPNAEQACLLGTGFIAHDQAKAMLMAIPTLKSMSIVGRNPDKVAQLVGDLGQAFPEVRFFGVPIEQKSALNAATLGADIVNICVNSAKPFATQFKPGALVVSAAVYCNDGSLAETVPAGLVKEAFIVGDDLVGVNAESAAIQKSGMKVEMSLADLLHHKSLNIPLEQSRLFITVGAGYFDIAAAVTALGFNSFSREDDSREHCVSHTQSSTEPKNLADSLTQPRNKVFAALGDQFTVIDRQNIERFFSHKREMLSPPATVAEEPRHDIGSENTIEEGRHTYTMGRYQGYAYLEVNSSHTDSSLSDFDNKNSVNSVMAQSELDDEHNNDWFLLLFNDEGDLVFLIDCEAANQYFENSPISDALTGGRHSRSKEKPESIAKSCIRSLALNTLK